MRRLVETYIVTQYASPAHFTRKAIQLHSEWKIAVTS